MSTTVRRCVAPALLFSAVVLGGCSSDRSLLTTTPTTSPEAPDWVGAAYGQSVAAADDDLVFPGDPCDGASPVLRRADGAWVELPQLPDAAGVPVAVGDTTAVWGADRCGDDLFGSDELHLAILSEDRRSWRRLDAPSERFDSETEALTDGWGGDIATIFVAGTTYLVERSGEVTALPEGPEGGRTECQTATHRVVVPHTTEVARSVSLLELEDLDAGWREGAALPPEVGPSYDNVLCGPHGVSVLGPTSAAEYSLAEDRWSTVASNFAAVSKGSVVPAPFEQRSAWAPDGTVVFVLGADDRVLSRTGTGAWLDTGHTAQRLVATSSSVEALGWDLEGPMEVGQLTIERIWPEG